MNFLKITFKRHVLDHGFICTNLIHSFTNIRHSFTENKVKVLAGRLLFEKIEKIIF